MLCKYEGDLQCTDCLRNNITFSFYVAATTQMSILYQLYLIAH